jgi:hypothetical protein
VDDLLNRKDSVDLVPINQESVSEKLPIDMPNLCKTLPNCDVVGQETSRPTLAEIFDLKSPSKNIDTTSSTSMLGSGRGGGGNETKATVLVAR